MWSRGKYRAGYNSFKIGPKFWATLALKSSPKGEKWPNPVTLMPNQWAKAHLHRLFQVGRNRHAWLFQNQDNQAIY